MFRNLIIVFVILSLIWIYISACSSKKSTEAIPAVENFRLNEYLGDWYEIARLPHYFERDMNYVKTNYSLNPDGTVRVVNRGIKDNKEKISVGIGKFSGAKDVGELEVSFFRPFWGSYKIIYLNDNYTLAIVTGDNKDYLWLLSRTPTLNSNEINFFLDKVILWGFDASKLIYPAQNPQN
ncbi:MAG: lipocalin family protein [Lentisphaeria bacterium]|nr:lipocalin family protein [Lentisphaeria bacterium]MBR7128547.1 lipocalin family protein [Lentisphaeria bacterium]